MAWNSDCARSPHPVGRRTLFALTATAVAIGVAVAGMAGWAIWRARQDAGLQAAITSQNLAMTLARAIESTVASYDRSLLAIARAIAAPGGDAPGVRQTLLDALISAPDLGPIAVTDADGRVVAATRAAGAMETSVAARDSFLQQRDSANGGLAIGRPFRGGSTGIHGSEAWSIALSRRLTRPDGSFGGIVMGTLPLRDFNALTDMMDVGRQGAVTLLRQDAILIARSPFNPDLIGQDVRVSRLFQRVADAPADLAAGPGATAVWVRCRWWSPSRSRPTRSMPAGGARPG
jgi:hypothetical protein